MTPNEQFRTIPKESHSEKIYRYWKLYLKISYTLYKLVQHPANVRANCMAGVLPLYVAYNWVKYPSLCLSDNAMQFVSLSGPFHCTKPDLTVQRGSTKFWS